MLESARTDGRFTGRPGKPRQPRQTEGVDSNPFPIGFLSDRGDPSPDSAFYSWPRLVTHLDDDAIAAVGALYDELGISGEVLELMSSWVSHFRTPPERLTVLGMNSDELDANPLAAVTVVHDLNADPRLPFPDQYFDAVVCCVSVDYLTRPHRSVRWTRPASCAQAGRSSVRSPIDAFRPRLCAAGSTPTTSAVAPSSKSTSASLEARDEPRSQRRTPASHLGDPLLAVWAHRARRAVPDDPATPAQDEPRYPSA